MAPKAEAQVLLDALEALGLPPFEEVDVATQRTVFNSKNPDAPDPPPIHSSEDITIPGPAGDIPARVLRPSAQEDLPVLVYFHGGGWVLGTVDGHDPLCRAIANAAAAIVVSIGYRLAPEDRYPASFEDCAAATAWVAGNAGSFGGNPDRLAVGGDSAGGNLAAAVSLWANDNSSPTVCAQVLIYPATNLAAPETPSYQRNANGYLLSANWMDWFVDQYLPDTSQREDAYASPALAGSHVDLPPALVVTAEFDPLLDDGTAYAKLLGDAGVNVVHQHWEGQIHGFATQINVMPDANTNAEQIGVFLAKTL